MVDIRPMRAGDEVDAEAAWDHAYRTLLIEQHLPTFDRTPAFIEHTRLRMAYLRDGDPGGSWVAETDGSIVGIAQAHVRGDRWVLATLGVVPDHQERGVGGALLDLALDYGKTAGIGAIFSSPDPRAVHRYASAGFDLHPTVVALGPARRLLEAPSGVREGAADDIEVVNAVDRAVRGGTRSADIEFQLGIWRPAAARQRARLRTHPRRAGMEPCCHWRGHGQPAPPGRRRPLSPRRDGQRVLDHRPPAMGHPGAGLRRRAAVRPRSRHDPRPLGAGAAVLGQRHLRIEHRPRSAWSERDHPD